MHNKRNIAIGIGVIAALFYLAAAFNVLPNSVGMFWGVVFALVSGLVWIFWPAKATQKKE